MACRIISGTTDYIRLIRGTDAVPEPIVQNLQPPFSVFFRINQHVLPGPLGGSVIKFDRIPFGFGGNLDYYLMNVAADGTGIRFGADASDFASDDTAVSELKSLNTPYDVLGTFNSLNLRQIIVNAVLEGTDTAFSDPNPGGGLEGFIIGAGYTSFPGTYNMPIGDACIQDLCVWRRVITTDDAALLLAGNSPLNLYTDDIIIWVPTLDEASITDAEEYTTLMGLPTAIPLTLEGTGGDGEITDCLDAGFPTEPVTSAMIGGSGVQVEPLGCVLSPQPFNLSANGFIRDLNGVLELGPFRFAEQKESDETSMITTLILGLSEADIGLVTFIDMALVANVTIDMDTLVDVLGDDIYIDMGEGTGNSDDFTLELLGNDDGSTYPGAPIEFKPEVLDPIEDRGSTKQYSPLGYSFIYHRVRLKATEIDEKFAVKFVDISGQLTGRLL